MNIGLEEISKVRQSIVKTHVNDQSVSKLLQLFEDAVHVNNSKKPKNSHHCCNDVNHIHGKHRVTVFYWVIVLEHNIVKLYPIVKFH